MVAGFQACTFSRANGVALSDIDGYTVKSDPIADAISWIANYDRPGIFVMCDLQHYIGTDPQRLDYGLVRQIKNLVQTLKQSKKRVILLGQGISLATDLQGIIQTVRNELPTSEAIADTIDNSIRDLCANYKPGGKKLTANVTDMERLIRVSQGLTLVELMDVLRLSAVVYSALDDRMTERINSYKIAKLKRLNCDFAEAPDVEVGGLANLKVWLKRRIRMFSSASISKGLPTPKGVMLVGLPGCQPAGSKVLMADGKFINVEEVKVGDRIISPQSNNTCEIATVRQIRQYDSEIYRVQMTNNKSQERAYLCSADHILPIACTHVKKQFGRQIYTPGFAEVKASDYNSQSKHFLSHSKTFTTPGYDLPEQSFRVHPYALGVILGDGCLRRYDYAAYNPAVTLNNHDLAIVDKLRELSICLGVEYVANGSSRFYICSDTRQALSDLFPASIGSHDKFIPDEYMLGSLEQRLWLLAGLVDTDGSACGEFTTVSIKLADQFCQLIHSIGGFASCVERYTSYCPEKRFLSYRIQYSIGDHQIPNQCKRKQLPVRNMKWKDPRRSSMSVTNLNYVDTVYGFTIDSESQWYVTDNFIVTHNSGKSLIAKTIGKIFGMPVLSVDMGSIYNSLVGESERNLRELLATAEAIAPAVLFIDEIEKSLSGVSNANDSGVSQRLFGKLLTWMSDHKAPVFVVATANNIQGLPPEFTRKGRFDEIFFCDAPNDEEREEILNIQLARFTKNHIDLTEVVAATHDFVGAELAALVQEAVLIAEDENRFPNILPSDLIQVANQTVPLIARQKDQIAHLREWARSNARAASATITVEAIAVTEQAGKIQMLE
jgi:hypothetical protein